MYGGAEWAIHLGLGPRPDPSLKMHQTSLTQLTYKLKWTRKKNIWYRLITRSRSFNFLLRFLLSSIAFKHRATINEHLLNESQQRVLYFSASRSSILIAIQWCFTDSRHSSINHDSRSSIIIAIQRFKHPSTKST